MVAQRQGGECHSELGWRRGLEGGLEDGLVGGLTSGLEGGLTGGLRGGLKGGERGGVKGGLEGVEGLEGALRKRERERAPSQTAALGPDEAGASSNERG